MDDRSRGGWATGGAGLLAAFALLTCALFFTPASAVAAPLSIKVEGNHFVNGEGQAIRLLGVNHTSSEYGCVDGFGYDDGHFDEADATAIAAWNANAVRIPLNEDCWLGINGQPNSNQGANPPLTQAGYQQEIESYVADLNAHGIYAILDLHWSAPGSQVALEQQPMPDEEHSPAFWASVASTFKNTPGVVFDVFNEPFSPTDPRSGNDPNAKDTVSWGCWANGGCETAAYGDEGNRTGARYKVAGMQSLITAIRKAGATQPIMLGGLNYANDLTGWLANKPTDPLGQLVASFHNYQGTGKCDTVACWNSQIAPVASAVPVVTGEFAEEVCTPSGFDSEYMSWADANGVSYLAWAWIVLSQGEINAYGCSAYYLISDYDGTPASVNGTTVHAHLLSLPPGGRAAAPASGGGPAPGGGSSVGSTGGASPAGSTAAGGSTPTPIRLTRFTPTVAAGGAAVSVRIAAVRTCSGTISGRTARRFRLGGRKPHPVALGSTKVSLTAGRTTTVTIKLAPKARGLLKAKGSLPSLFTVALRAGDAAPTVLHPTATLTEPRPKR